MFCIAAFIVFIILGIFSAKYRTLARKAWSCVAKKLTFRPCDVGFKEEAKSVLIGKFIINKPRLARFLDRWIEALSTIFVILSIWSLLVVMESGLYLFVYDTCSPSDVESCSLGGESCGISTGQETFLESVVNLNTLDWSIEKVSFLAETASRIPDRFKKWKPEEYIDQSASYYNPFDSQKKIALEIIDPGCTFCAKLFRNMKTAAFEDNYNITYIPYAIPDANSASGYKFPNSPLVISYLEAVKAYPLHSDIPADWQILELIFLGKEPNGTSYQENFNLLYSSKEVEDILLAWLKEIGYSQQQIEDIQVQAKSDSIKNKVQAQVYLVEENIRTIKIPTIIFDDRRYDRVIGPEKLNK